MAVPATAIPCVMAPPAPALLGRQPLEENPAHVAREILELRRGGRIGGDVPLAHADDAGGERDVEPRHGVVPDDELGRAPADVDDDGRLQGRGGSCAVVHRAEERELRLLLAGEHACVERELAPDPLGELGAVGRVADGGGEHGEVRGALVGVDFATVVGERREHAVDRGGGERPGGVDPLAEPRDGRAPHELGDLAGG